ncbi:MAG: STAS domain-containing protein [Spirochaetales bacterium]|nr:STAS domain-containing protein [Spirochaetales bacterium]
MKKDIEANFTIENAKSIAGALNKYIKTSDNPVIDLSVVKKIDLSGIQLLIAAHKTGEKLGKPVYFTGNITKNIYDLLNDNGFSLVHLESDEKLFTVRRSSREF